MSLTRLISPIAIDMLLFRGRLSVSLFVSLFVWLSVCLSPTEKCLLRARKL